MVTLSEFASFMGADTGTAELAEALAVGQALTDQALAYAYRGVPEPVYDFLVKTVAQNIYRRSESSDGQYESAAPQPANDPLQQVRPVLRQYVMFV